MASRKVLKVVPPPKNVVEFDISRSPEIQTVLDEAPVVFTHPPKTLEGWIELANQGCSSAASSLRAAMVAFAVIKVIAAKK
jgi:hypothetical protein